MHENYLKELFHVPEFMFCVATEIWPKHTFQGDYDIIFITYTFVCCTDLNQLLVYDHLIITHINGQKQCGVDKTSTKGIYPLSVVLKGTYFYLKKYFGDFL